MWILTSTILRATLSQSFPWSPEGVISYSVIILILVFGYIITTWFSTLLGTFITINLYEPQIKSLKDMRIARMKFVHPYRNENIEGMDNFNISSDLAEFVSEDEFEEILNSNQSSFGVLLENFGYDLVYKNYIIMDFIMDYNFMSLYLGYNPLYNSRINDYITIVKDTGLFDYWNKNYDLYKNGFVKLTSKPLNYKFLRVLDLHFFNYPFKGLIWSLVASTFVFFVEFAIFVYIKYLKNRKYNTAKIIKLNISCFHCKFKFNFK